MLVELKNGETLNGHLVNCDTWMNLTLKEVVQTSPEGDRFWRLPEAYVRGNNVSILGETRSSAKRHRSNTCECQMKSSILSRNNNRINHLTVAPGVEVIVEILEVVTEVVVDVETGDTIADGEHDELIYT